MNIFARLSEKFSMRKDDLVEYVISAPHRYKEYTIPKRNGRGLREIAQPAKELKVLQRVVLDEYFSDLPIHSAAMAYREGIGIKDNAEKHSPNQYLLKMDFSDFFPSIKSEDFLAHVRKHKGVVKIEDKFAIKKLFFWVKKGSSVHKLSIGAPSSPFISNTLMFDFDCALDDLCKNEGVTYTRYADDITLTTNKAGVLFKFPSIVENILEQIEYPRLTVNTKKTVFSSKKSNRHVTGLVLANDNSVSLGRERKRYIKSLVYKFSSSGMPSADILHLKGLLSFAKHVEPKFYDSLVKKYGSQVIRNLAEYSASE